MEAAVAALAGDAAAVEDVEEVAEVVGVDAGAVVVVESELRMATEPDAMVVGVVAAAAAVDLDVAWAMVM